MHPAERVLAMLAGAETTLGAKTPASWAPLKERLRVSAAETAPDAPAAAAEARGALLKALRSLAPVTDLYDIRLAEALLGSSLRFQNWDAGMTRLLAADTETEAVVNLQAGISPVAPETSCKITFPELPGWLFPTGAVTRLSPGKSDTLKLSLRAPASPKGFFRLPATVEYSGEGWSFKCEARLRTLTENRICQWVAAGPFADPAKAQAENHDWQALTNANVHGAMNLNALLGPNTTGMTAVAVAVLRVARPTAVRFNFSGPVRLYVDGARIGTDAQRGSWGGAALAPGDHIVKAVTIPEKKEGWTFKVACDLAETCLPGDLLALPAAHIFR